MDRAEYSYDNAYQSIIALNEIYNPSFIYCDRGSGEYIIERLHIYGEEHPESGLKAKVKGWSFANKLDMMDPITKEMVRQPIKPFMVNQLQLLIERGELILSPYDNVLSKQLMDYEVEKITQSGQPIYTSENEHFVDALGLANLALVLEFKDLMGVIKDIQTTNKVEILKKSFGNARVDSDLSARGTGFMDSRVRDFYNNTDFSDRKGDRQEWVKVDMNYRSKRSMSSSGWGSRSVGGFGRR